MTTTGRPLLPVVFIGPACAGKSTLAGILADQMGRPDGPTAGDYCADAGYSRADYRKVQHQFGPAMARRPLPELFAGAVERIVAEHPDHIIDLGAGHTDIRDAVLFARIQRARARCPHVILVLPSADPDASVRILKERAWALRGHDWVRNGVYRALGQAIPQP